MYQQQYYIPHVHIVSICTDMYTYHIYVTYICTCVYVLYVYVHTYTYTYDGGVSYHTVYTTCHMCVHIAIPILYTQVYMAYTEVYIYDRYYIHLLQYCHMSYVSHMSCMVTYTYIYIQQYMSILTDSPTYCPILYNMWIYILLYYPIDSMIRTDICIYGICILHYMYISVYVYIL